MTPDRRRIIAEIPAPAFTTAQFLLVAMPLSIAGAVTLLAVCILF